MAENAKPKGKAKRGDGKEKVVGGRKGDAAARAKHGMQMGTRSQKRQPDAPARTSPNVPKKSSIRTRGGGQGAGGK
jgi:hypothetical protein